MERAAFVLRAARAQAQQDRKPQEPQQAQNENIAAFFLVPNMYTSAWLMKSPTVMPIVTAIIALPISIPFPDAVIAPPPA